MTLTVTSYPVAELRTYVKNPRRHNIDAIKQSLTVNGQYRPIVVNAGTHTGRPYEVLAGNGTLTAARDLGWPTVDAVTVDVDEDQAARIVAADNRTSDLAEYDDRLLAELLGSLPTLDGTGYEPGDLDELLRDLDNAGADGPPDDPADLGELEDSDERTTGFPDGPYSLDELVETTAAYIELHGPPEIERLPVHRCMLDVNRLRNTPADKLRTTKLGLAAANSYHPHRVHVPVDGTRTVAEICAKPDALRRGVRFHLEQGGSLSPAALLGTLGFTRNGQIAANFRPGYALAMYRRFAPAGGTVLDTSTGFGGRLVAFAASDCGRYIGVDPSSATHAGNAELARDLGIADRVELICEPAEDVDVDRLRGRCDFAFTSPPYFAKERYSDEPTQSYVRYPEPDAWRVGFLEPMLRLQAAALVSGAHSVINIADVRIGGTVVPLVEWTVAAAAAAGFDLLDDTERLPLSRVPGANRSTGFAGGENGEPVLIFRLP